jgi:hypothetical protein
VAGAIATVAPGWGVGGAGDLDRPVDGGARRRRGKFWPWLPRDAGRGLAITLLAVILLATARSRIELMAASTGRCLHRRLLIAVGLIVAHVLLYIPPTVEMGPRSRPGGEFGRPGADLRRHRFGRCSPDGLAYFRGLPYEGGHAARLSADLPAAGAHCCSKAARCWRSSRSDSGCGSWSWSDSAPGPTGSSSTAGSRRATATGSRRWSRARATPSTSCCARATAA